MNRTDLENIARDLNELRIEIDRVLGRVLTTLRAEVIEAERLEHSRGSRELPRTGKGER